MSLLTTGTELKRFRRSLLPKISLGVLMFIPLIYGALYLWAFWNPTTHMNRLSVALVNKDQPAMSSHGLIRAGASLQRKLLQRQNLGWHVVSAKQAETGIKDGKYYFMVTIPAGFSTRIAGAASSDARPARIHVTYNDTNSFLATTLGNEVMLQIRSTVSQSTSRQLTQALLTGTQQLSQGIRQAAGASRKLHTGAGTLSTSTGTLKTGLGELAAGATSLHTGSSQVSSGASELAGSLAPATAKSATLASGAKSVAAGASTLETGLSSLKSGSTALASGLGTLRSDTSSLTAKTSQLSSGAGGVASILAAIKTLDAQSGGTLTLAQVDAALSQYGGISGAAADASAVASGAGQLASSSPALVSAIASAANGSARLSSGVTSAVSGAGSLQSGSGEVATGASTLAAGVASASSAASEIASGAGTLTSGSGKLASSAATAASGAGQLSTGAAKLDTKLGTFARATSKGASRAPQFTAAQTRRVADVVATPVQLSTRTLNYVSSWGAGFAPFFIALATFVGALITWLILRPLPARPLGSNVSGLRHALTGFVPAALVAIGQVIVMLLVLRFGIGLRPLHWLATGLFVLLVTLAFLALQQMLIVLFGSAPGRVVALVLLMLQLSSCGGTYPVQTSPHFFNVIHPFMPATYVVNALRPLIGGGVGSRFWVGLAVFVGLLVVPLAISAVSAGRQKVWTITRLHPELTL
jgi:putative membrane protein